MIRPLSYFLTFRPGYASPSRIRNFLQDFEESRMTWPATTESQSKRLKAVFKYALQRHQAAGNGYNQTPGRNFGKPIKKVIGGPALIYSGPNMELARELQTQAKMFN